jgi:hypothetical protein
VIAARRLGIVSVAFVLSTHLLYAQPGPRYRDFQLGGDLASVSALAGVTAADAKIMHQRPVLIQDLEWRLPYALTGPSAPSPDPVERIVFTFYSDQLCRVVIDYDHNRTEGMTDADMIDAVSSVYGSPSKVLQKRPVASSQVIEESGTRLAQWGGGDYTVVLYQSTYRSFRMIVTSPRLDALARSAEAEAVRLDERDAPKRELARQTKEADDKRAAQEKARLANKALFRP